jgi:hypothetical protein
LKFEIRHFNASDLDQIEMRPFEAKIKAGLDRSFGPLFEKAGPAYTALINDRIAFCAGFGILYRGVAEVWAATSPLVERYPILFHSTVKMFLERTINDLKLWRVQVVVEREHRVSRNWLERLGFSAEGPATALGPDGQDMIHMAMIVKRHLPQKREAA